MTVYNAYLYQNTSVRGIICPCYIHQHSISTIV